mgnify:CR=1 FL=1
MYDYSDYSDYYTEIELGDPNPPAYYDDGLLDDLNETPQDDWMAHEAGSADFAYETLIDWPGASDIQTPMTLVERADEIRATLMDAPDTARAAEWLLELGIGIVLTQGTSGPHEKEKLPAWLPAPADFVGDKKWNTNANPIRDYADLTDDRGSLIDDRYGVGVCPSLETGLIVIDADTPAEVEALREWFFDATGSELPPPTIQTPGKIDADGSVRHSEGGHWYCVIPPLSADEAAKYRDKTTVKYGSGAGDHFDVMAGASYAITAPSVRSEGAYRVTGRVQLTDPGDDLYEALMAALTKKVTTVATTEAGSEAPPMRLVAAPDGATSAERADAWAAQTPWTSVLSGTPISFTGENECGGTCSEVHRDGATTRRSGVAHETGCPNGFSGRLILFSSTAQAEDGTSGMSKMTAYTKYHHGGDYKAALAALGLRDEDTPGYDPNAWKAAKKAQRAQKATHADGLTEEEKAALRDRKAAQAADSAAADTKADDDEPGLAKAKLVDAYATETFHAVETTAGIHAYLRKGEYTATPESAVVDELMNATPAGRMAIRDDMARRVLSGLRYDWAAKKLPAVETDPRVLKGADGASYVYTGDAGPKGIVRLGSDGLSYDVSAAGPLVYTPPSGAPAMDVDWDNPAPLDELWKLINVPSDRRALILTWMLTRWINPHAGLPVLILEGVAGSGKTETAKYVKSLIDPELNGTETLPGSEEKAAAPLAGRGALVYDNIRTIAPAVSDLLCRVSTGGSHTGRKMYTNNESVTVSYRASLILTCVNLPTIQSDLRTRSAYVKTTPIPEADRTTMGALEAARAEMAPRLRATLFSLAGEIAALMASEDLPTRGLRLADAQQILEAVTRLTGMGSPLELANGQLGLTDNGAHDISVWMSENPRVWDSKELRGKSGVFKAIYDDARAAGHPNLQNWPKRAQGWTPIREADKTFLERHFVITEDDRNLRIEPRDGVDDGGLVTDLVTDL